MLTSVHIVQVQSITASDSLVRWLIEENGLLPQRADVTAARPDGSWAAFANQDVKEGEVGQTTLACPVSVKHFPAVVSCLPIASL